MILAGRNVMSEPLSVRRDLLREHIIPNLVEPVGHSPQFDASHGDLIASVRAQSLKGIVAKLLNSVY
jgi:ATP-dependent DNA ligase